MNKDEASFEKKRNRFHRYLEYASALINSYNGAEPFHLYLKKYFSVNKKHGSRDRKQIASLCYCYFRLGFGVSLSSTVEDKLILATFLVEKKPSLFLETFNPAWNKNISLETGRKLEMLNGFFDSEKMFPFRDALSDEINFPDFSLSFLIQPKLFIRIRPGHKNAIYDKLKSASISFEKISNSCLAFANNEKLNDILNIDKEAVIQDYNSQQTLSLLTSRIQPSAFSLPPSGISLWDCCAASGGKSILAHDLLKNVKLTVSDTRRNILENLRKRFERAGIRNYRSFVADVSALPLPEGFREGRSFDLIIADVPCSGSGTWSRTPEQLHFFRKESISKYAALQKKIVANAANLLKESGLFLYITCSVFKEENEENVNFIRNELHLELIENKYLKGYGTQADTLFVALFGISKK